MTVDQWATLLPLHRDGQLFRHAFEDCAHWWALAHHCLAALKEIHQLQLVHLDIKGDNVCIPLGPADFDPDAPDIPLFPVFRQLALIDFAFSLVSRESLTAPLPIGWQREYDYQSPRLLKALEDGHDGDLRPRASSIGVATSTASRRCSSATCRTRRCCTSRNGDRLDQRALRSGEGADPDAARAPRSRRAAGASAPGADRRHRRPVAGERPRAVVGYRVDVRARLQRRALRADPAHAADPARGPAARVRFAAQPRADARAGPVRRAARDRRAADGHEANRRPSAAARAQARPLRGARRRDDACARRGGRAGDFPRRHPRLAGRGTGMARRPAAADRIPRRRLPTPGKRAAPAAPETTTAQEPEAPPSAPRLPLRSPPVRRPPPPTRRPARRRRRSAPSGATTPPWPAARDARVRGPATRCDDRFGGPATRRDARGRRPATRCDDRVSGPAARRDDGHDGRAVRLGACAAGESQGGGAGP